jgi:hypothetical protein
MYIHTAGLTFWPWFICVNPRSYSLHWILSKGPCLKALVCLDLLAPWSQSVSKSLLSCLLDFNLIKGLHWLDYHHCSWRGVEANSPALEEQICVQLFHPVPWGGGQAKKQKLGEPKAFQDCRFKELNFNIQWLKRPRLSLLITDGLVEWPKW